jgi:hypothetical protein
MPDSAVLTFTDPDAYYATIRTAEVKGIVTVRGDYRAELTRIDLHRLWMQRGVEGLPRVMNVRRRDPRVALCFTTDQEQAPLHVGGMEPGRGEFAVLGSGSADHHLSSAACRWGAMSLMPEDLAAAGRAIVGREVTAPSPLSYRLSPPPAVLLRPLNLHEAAGHLAKTAPDILAHPEVARALEQGLTHAMVTCISGGETAETVGAFPPNGYGLFDMAGTVWEWTTDWFRARHEPEVSSPCCVSDNPRNGPVEASYDPAQPQIGSRVRWSRGARFSALQTIAGATVRQRATLR